MIRLRSILLGSMVALAVDLGATDFPETDIPPADPPSTRAEPSEDDLLIIELRLGRDLVLEPGLIAYRHPDGFLLPLGGVMAALRFAIAVRPDVGLATGWFLTEERHFALDLSRGEVRVGGETEDLPAAGVFRQVDDLYVDSALLSRWFPIDFALDLAKLRVTVTAREKLPIELEVGKTQGRDLATIRRRKPVTGPRYPHLEVPYRWFDWPMLESSLISRWNSQGTETRFAFLAQGDLLAMSSEFFYDSLADNLRWRLRRRHPDKTLLGPLRLREFGLGDLSSPHQLMVSRPRRGRGFEISSFPLHRQTAGRRTTLEGDLLPGWRVELERNGVLIDAQTAGPDGNYAFIDIDLLLGQNILRLIFTGPQGEQRIKTERIFVGPDQVETGETHYRFGIYQQDEGLLGSSEISLAAPVGPEPSVSVRGEPRIFAEIERGFGQRFSASAGYSSLPDEDEGRRDYAHLGVEASFRGILSQLYLVAEPEGGWAGQATLRTRLGRLDILAEHTEFSEFESEDLPASDGLERRTEVRLNGRLSFLGRRLPFAATAKVETRVRTQTVELGLRFFAYLHGLNISNSFDYNQVGDSAMTRGFLLVSGTLKGVRLFGDLGYRLQPEAMLETVALTAERALRPKLSTRLNLNHNLLDGGDTSLTGSLNWEMKPVRWSASLGYSEAGGMQAGVSMSTSIFRRPGVDAWRLTANSVARQGAVSARVFIDNDSDGTFGDDDIALEGIQLQANGRTIGYPTGADGFAFITGLRTFRHLDIGIAEDTIADPFMVPSRTGVNLIPRPGLAVPIDFPITLSGEVEGKVYLRKSESKMEVANVQVVLLDVERRTVVETRSSFDGFYLLEKVPPGTYLLAIDAEQISRLGLEPPADREIVVESGEVVSGIDVVLEQSPADPMTITAVEKPSLPILASLPTLPQSLLIESPTALPQSPQTEGPPAVSAATAREASSAKLPEGRKVFELQLGTFRRRSGAESFVTEYRQRGYGPYIRKAKSPGGADWFTVRLGPYWSLDEVMVLAEEVRQREDLATVIRYRILSP